MQAIVKILEKIIKNKAGIIPAFIYDKSGIFENYFNCLSADISVAILKDSSKISLQKHLTNFDTKKDCVIYSKFNINIDGFIASDKLRAVEITPDLLLRFCNETKDKLSANITLTEEQLEIFVTNFDTVIDDIIISDIISNETIKSSLTKVFMGKVSTPKELLVSFIKGDFSVDKLKSIYLYDKISTVIKDSFNIDISGIEDNNNLFEKIIITLLLSELKKDFWTEFNDCIINTKEAELNKLFEFIKVNSSHFEKEIADIDKKFQNKIPPKITYTVPFLFESYIAENISNYTSITINNELLWTESMKVVALFINKISELDGLLKQYVSFSFNTNTMGGIIKEYKESLFEIDCLYRETSALYEELTYNFAFYMQIEKSNIVDKINDMYFNVLSNINGKYISVYNKLLADNSDAIRQDNVLKKLSFNKKTVFIFADGLRYELAKNKLNDIACKKIVDYDVFSLLPTETEVCMNGYFITDEILRLNNKNIFELIKNNKQVTQTIKWRIEKLGQILGCDVIAFEKFKATSNYEGSVICFYNDIDTAMHSYDSAKKITSAVDELKNIIDYSVNRNFDVFVLSDHGFIDIEQKIELQDGDLDSEKKKSRYLIINSNEKAYTMFYKKDLPVADFIQMQSKEICFINSINSLKQTTRYTHGGVSLQENIITAILFKSQQESDMRSAQKHIGILEAYNELKVDIFNAKYFECSVYAGSKKIFACIIEDDNFSLKIPIRNYNKGDQFLVSISNGSVSEKNTIRKSGNTVIDKDLDIF